MLNINKLKLKNLIIIFVRLVAYLSFPRRPGAGRVRAAALGVGRRGREARRHATVALRVARRYVAAPIVTETFVLHYIFYTF